MVAATATKRGGHEKGAKDHDWAVQLTRSYLARLRHNSAPVKQQVNMGKGDHVVCIAVQL